MNTRYVFSGPIVGKVCRILFVFAIFLSCAVANSFAQTNNASDAAAQDRMRALTEAMNRVEMQIQEAQRELEQIRQQLATFHDATGAKGESASSQATGVVELAEAVRSLREGQAMQETQISTLEQAKVETNSKYRLKLNGMVLMTGFINTQKVDAAPTPTIALGGPGSTGITLQQTVLGIDAAGPHLFGASSHADLRFDLNGGSPGTGNYSGYKVALMRLRTAHAELNWDRTRAYFALDRTGINPGSPTSITAVAVPPLAWSGNLWSWNPQFGVSHDVWKMHSGRIGVQAALTDVADPPPLFTASQNSTYTPPSTGELSHWPGAEWRIGYEGSDHESGLRLGVGGFFAAHRTAGSATKFNSWAGAADFRIPVTHRMQLSGNAYRGAALGVLGAGAYKDYVLRNVGTETYFKSLDDEGGWIQWKQKFGERLEFNEAFGIDNVPAHQLRPFAISTPVSYYNLARNRTVTGNIIYAPSAYILLSLEYRRIASSYVTSPTFYSNVIAIGSGYQF